MNTETIMDLGLTYGLKIVLALAIFFVGKAIVKIAVNVAKKLMVKAKVDETLISFAGNVLFGLAMAFVVIAALSQLGIETTSLAAVIAAAGLAIGLALQGSLSNLAAGVMIILFRPFKLGDFIEVADIVGKVKEISIFTTTLTTADNQCVIIPNSTITDGNIINITANPKRRLDLVVGVGYGDDLKKVKASLHKILEKSEYVLKTPEAVVGVLELADNSVNLVVRPWVKTKDYWSAHFELTETIKTTFDKEGISIPYPQRDLHIIDGAVEGLKKVA